MPYTKFVVVFAVVVFVIFRTPLTQRPYFIFSLFSLVQICCVTRLLHIVVVAGHV